VLTLHHTAGAICAQKVRVCLAEKGAEWESRLVGPGDLRSPEYLKINPGGYVPTLVHDRRIIPESRIINEYLNEALPGPPLMPTSPYERARVGLWTKQIDDTLHLSIFTLSCALILRHTFAAMTPEQQEVSLPLDLTKRERTRDLMAKGEHSHYVPAAVQRFARLMEEMERALQQSSWLAGDAYSLADVDFTPYLQRLHDLGLAWLWSDKPAVQDWWGRVQSRPSFGQVKAAWMSAEELAKQAEWTEIGAKTLSFRS
jgi:glutathione S-transferase